MRLFQNGCAIVVAIFLSSAAYSEDLTTMSNPEALGFSPLRLGRITSWYQSRVDSRDIPGAVVAIVRNGKLAYFETIGFQDRGKLIPIKRDTIFWIASMTKPVTSVAAMILVDEGKLDLNAPVSQYLPELKDMPVVVEGSDTGQGELKTEPQKQPMTVLDLLRHTSGLVYPPQYLGSPIHRRYSKAVFTRDHTLAEFVTSLGKLPLAHQPGEVWEYSFSADVLGRVVEVASGQSLDDFLSERIFQPLHMADTGFYVPPEKLGRLADPPGERREALWDLTTKPKLFSGGGGLASTAPDYLRFCQMLLNGGELDGVRVLKPDTVRLMTSNSLPPNIRFAMDFIGPDAGSTWGLGFAIRTDAERSFVPGSVGSYAWNGAGGTEFWIDPSENLIAVQMLQTYNDHRPYQGALRKLAYGALRVPEQSPPPPSSSPTPTVTLSDYAGVFDFGRATSPFDKRIERAKVGIAAISTTDDGAVKVIGVAEEGPADKAGIRPGDLITEIDDKLTRAMPVSEIVSKAEGPIGSTLRVKVLRSGVENHAEVTITRELMRSHEVELRFGVEDGKLVAESTGAWPVLDFGQGMSIALLSLGDGKFYASVGDHTRVAFVRDAKGKIVEAVLNPGVWELRGRRVE
jgi:CubicO group peptidase (beta-lactamase class C family)